MSYNYDVLFTTFIELNMLMLQGELFGELSLCWHVEHVIVF